MPGAQAISQPSDGDYSAGDTTQGLGNNMAIGADELCSMMMLLNTPYGCHALEGNTTGMHNTAIGFNALENDAMGNNNTAIGFVALYSNTGSDNIALGARAGVYHMSGDNNIYIGNTGIQSSETGQIRIGTPMLQTGTYIAGIRTAAVTGSPVVVDPLGRLGVTTSSAKFKEAIKPMDGASEAILALKPVSFHYKKEVDPEGIPQFGLVAEEVEKINADLVTRDAEGKVFTVRYDQINAMLLNEFLKEHRKVETLEATVASLAATVKEQATQIQKVSAQLELSRPISQTVLNNQ